MTNFQKNRLFLHLVTNIFSHMFTIIFWIIVALIAYAFREELMAAAAFVGIFMGVGALLFWWWFDDPSLGSKVGFGFAIFIGSKILFEVLGKRYANIFEYTYRVISFPFWLLNRIQLILIGPWRYVFKYVSVGDSSRNVLRPLSHFLQILLYIVTTPLRLLNAILYNIVIYGITELYDLICEVFFPHSYDEGKASFWGWILWFPVRLVRYPLFHGSLVLIEGMIWTVIDIFIPTITMYHGTNLQAAQSIVGSSERNRSLWNNWLAGTFKASDSANGWGGLGVYFSPSRKVAGGYSDRAGGIPVFIACRVSFGKILNYALSPRDVEANVGGSGRHSVLNKYAEANHYVTAEWWNGGYWEYCMFDWQNRYNEPWRIRPIYVFNLSTGLAQHIDGGFRHWLFSKAVYDDIIKSFRFCMLLLFAVFFVIWFFIILFKANWSFPEKYIPQSHTETVYEQDPPVYQEPLYESPVVEEPVNAIQSEPLAKTKSSSGSPKSKPKRKKNKKPAAEQIETPKGTGFRLERVDHIPDPKNPNDKARPKLKSKVEPIEQPKQEKKYDNSIFNGY